MPAHNEHSIIFYNYEFAFECNLFKYKSGHEIDRFPIFFSFSTRSMNKTFRSCQLRNFDPSQLALSALNKIIECFSISVR